MYYPGMTIPINTIGNVANGKIWVQNISTGGTKQVIFQITAPWGEIVPDSGGVEGNEFRWIKTLYNPTRNMRYLVKIINVNELTRTATFQVLSYVDDASIANNINITNNLPTEGIPGQSINYNFDVVNNSPTSVQIRYLLASKDGSAGDLPIISELEALPPTIYRNKKCWYDDWATGGMCATGATIPINGHENISGTMTTSPTAGIYTNMRLRIFVYKSGYWHTTPGLPGVNPDPTGDEYVAPQLSGDNITWVLSSLCAGAPPCPDKCIRDPTTGIWSKWSQQCNPTTGLCEPVTIIPPPDDPTCCTPNWQCEVGMTGFEIDGCGHRRANNLCYATHYAEFDISFLPTDWLNYVGSEIADISNSLATYLPTFDNIQYLGASYTNGKFRLYFKYTTPLSATISIGDPIYILNTYKLYKEYNLYSEIKSLITIGLGDFIAFIAGIVVFLLGMKFLTYAFAIGGPIFALAVGAIVVGIAAVVLKWIIFDMSTGTPTSTENPSAPPPDKQIQIVREFNMQYLLKACADLHPTCATTPPTCNNQEMMLYNDCRGGAQLAQMAHDDTKSGTFDQAKYDDLKNRILATTECLRTGNCTVEQAKTQIDDRQSEVNNNSIEKQSLTTCRSGEIYDVNQKKCIITDQCAVKNPLTGTCIVTKGAISGAIMVVGLLVGGYILFKVVTRPKAQEVVIKGEK